MFQKYTIYISSREQKSSAHRKYCSNVEQGKKRQDSRQLLPTHLLRRVNFTYFSHDQKEEEKMAYFRQKYRENHSHPVG